MSLLYFCFTLTSLVTADHIIFHDAPRAKEGSECVCSVELPDDVFPTHMIQILKHNHNNLTYLIDQETAEILKIQTEIDAFEQALKNLTDKIRDMEINGIKDQTDFTNTKNTIVQLMKLAKDITDRLNGTDTKVEDLLIQVNNISSVVWQLESYDVNQVLVTNREIAILRKQLADCEEAAATANFGAPSPGLTPPEYGKCGNKVLWSISKPFVVRGNWKGFSFIYGAWGKDFALNNKNPDMYWVAPLNTNERLMDHFRTYRNYTKLGLNQHEKDKGLSQKTGLSWNYINAGQGSGLIMYNGSLYYNCHNSRNLCKLDVAKNTIRRKEVDGAAYNNWYSYAGVNWQDFDFAGDEKGLWVVYATENRGGKITIGKVNPNSLKIEKSWETSLYKPNVTNTFMVCGVLYALRRVNAQKEKLFYSFDTNVGKEFPLNIEMEKISATIQSVSYNPNDHKLYVYDNGYLVTHDVGFKQLSTRERRSVASEAGQNAIIPSNGRRQQLTAIA